MTKKDYQKIAQALKDSRPVNLGKFFVEGCPTEIFGRGQIASWNDTVNMIADTLSNDNPRFNRNRFLVACGYTNN